MDFNLLLLLLFIPRREMHSILQWGPFVFTYVLFWGSEALEHFKNL